MYTYCYQKGKIEVKNAVYWLTVRYNVGEWCICKTNQHVK